MKERQTKRTNKRSFAATAAGWSGLACRTHAIRCSRHCPQEEADDLAPVGTLHARIAWQQKIFGACSAAQRSAPPTHSRATDGAAGPTEWAHFRGAAAAPGDAAAAQQKHKLVSMMQKRCFYHTPVGAGSHARRARALAVPRGSVSFGTGGATTMQRAAWRAFAISARTLCSFVRLRVCLFVCLRVSWGGRYAEDVQLQDKPSQIFTCALPAHTGVPRWAAVGSAEYSPERTHPLPCLRPYAAEKCSAEAETAVSHAA